MYEIKNLVSLYRQSVDQRNRRQANTPTSEVYEIVRAALGVKNTSAFKSLTCSLICMILSNFSLQWDYLPGDIKRDLLDAIYNKSAEAEPQQIADIICSLGEIGVTWRDAIDYNIHHNLKQGISVNCDKFSAQPVKYFINLIRGLNKMQVVLRDLDGVRSRLRVAILQNIDALNVTQLVLLLSTLSKMGMEWSDGMENSLGTDMRLAFQQTLHATSRELDDRSISMAIYALRNMGATWNTLGNIKDSIQHAINTVTRFSKDNLVDIIYSLSKMEAKWDTLNDTTKNQLFSAIYRDVEILDEASITKLIFSLSHMHLMWSNIESGNLKRAISNTIIFYANSDKTNQQFSDNSLVMIVSGLASMGRTKDNLEPNLLNALCTSIFKHALSFDEQGIANLFTALVKMNLSLEDLGNDIKLRLLESIQRNAHTLNAIGTSSLIYALSRMGIKWHQLEQETQKRLHAAILRNADGNQEEQRFDTQNISNILYALNRMGRKWEKMGEKLPNVLLASINNNVKFFNALDIFNTLDALAKWGIVWNELPVGIKEGVLSAINNQYQNFDAEELATIISALSTMGAKAHELIAVQNAITGSICNLTHRFNANKAVRIVCGLANMGFAWGALSNAHDSLLRIMQDNAQYFDAQMLSNVLDATIKLGVNLDKQLFNSVLCPVMNKLITCIDPSITNLHEGFESVQSLLRISLCQDVRFDQEHMANTLNILSALGSKWLALNRQPKLNGNNTHIINSLYALTKLGLNFRELANEIQDSLLTAINSKESGFNQEEEKYTNEYLTELGYNKRIRDSSSSDDNIEHDAKQAKTTVLEEEVEDLSIAYMYRSKSAAIAQEKHYVDKGYFSDGDNRPKNKMSY